MFDDLKSNMRVAPFWERWAARLFGRRYVNRDGDVTAIAYRWRGRVYLGRVSIQ